MTQESLRRRTPHTLEIADMSAQPVLINGQWVASSGRETFQALNPRTRELLPERYPVSPWAEVEQAILAADAAARAARSLSGEHFARFLEGFADRIDNRKSDLVALAHAETALPVTPRLQDAELPRTTNQLRQAAAAARDGSWALPTIDTKANIRSVLGPLGPVAVFGPNNFPFAFNSVAGGDFAAAVAAGNPVIAKAHSSHPGTTRLLAELAHAAAEEASLPKGFIQLIYRTSHADGAKLVSHRLMGAAGYTGARSAGLVLKAAADAVGKPIYLELSSINPVYFLPGAVRERAGELVEQFAGSCLMGTGQFCTNPGMVLMVAGAETEGVVAQIAARFQAAPVGTLLGEGVLRNLSDAVQALMAAGAELIAGGGAGGGTGVSYHNTLLRVAGSQFLESPEELQTEAFGNESLIVVADSPAQLAKITEHLEGNLTGCIYSANDGSDDELYNQIAPALRQKVGRLLNDKMPTGVAVSPAMNHGGPFPATGHPGFTAVGIPASLRRFGMLHCYDGVRPHRLPPILQNQNAPSKPWRLIDGAWTQADV